MLKRLRFWWYITKAIFRGQPVRTWRRLGDQYGKPECYVCDGDCGVYSLHGVCTCGLSHFFKPESGGRKKVLRSNVSWHREYQTERVMMHEPREDFCPHGLSWDERCQTCREEVERAMQVFMTEWNKS